MTRAHTTALLLAWSLSGCTQGLPRDPEAAPVIYGKELGGEYWSSDDGVGKVQLVNVWATWCAPCRNELPTLEELHDNFGGPDFELVGVSIDAEKDRDAVEAMARRFGLSYRIVLDPQKRISEDWRISSYPTSVLLDRRGRERWRRKGEIRARDTEVVSAIKEALVAPTSVP